MGNPRAQRKTSPEPGGFMGPSEPHGSVGGMHLRSADILYKVWETASRWICGTIGALWIGGRVVFGVGRYINISVSTLHRSHQRYQQYRTRLSSVMSGISFLGFVC